MKVIILILILAFGICSNGYSQSFGENRSLSWWLDNNFTSLKIEKYNSKGKTHSEIQIQFSLKDSIVRFYKKEKKDLVLTRTDSLGQPNKNRITVDSITFYSLKAEYRFQYDTSITYYSGTEYPKFETNQIVESSNDSLTTHSYQMIHHEYSKKDSSGLYHVRFSTILINRYDENETKSYKVILNDNLQIAKVEFYDDRTELDGYWIYTYNK